MQAEINKQLFELGFDVADNTSALLAYCDKNLICRYANKAYLNWFGIKPEDMIDKMHMRDIVGPLYEQNLVYIKAALNGKSQVFERQLTNASGQVKQARATYFPDFENGQVKGIYVYVADISPLSPVPLNGVESETEKKYVFSNNQLLADVVQSLKSSVMGEFPGITNLAKKHLISESKLKRDFKEQYGATIFSFYRNLQMEVAFKYITEKKCNKSQMALMLGFANPSNFLVCYKKYLEENSTKQLIESVKKENDERYKTFISQAPFAFAMFDNNMAFMAASQRWMKAYGLDNVEFIGKPIYEVFPIVETRFKALLKYCLKGNISKSDEGFFPKQDGSPGWIRWDIRPWYDRNEAIGGLLIYTEDITAVKLKDELNRQILEILTKTNEITRVGAWSRNLRTNKAIWNNITKEILEVPEDFEPDVDTAIGFYKEGPSRQLIEKVMKDALEKEKTFDVEVEMVTAKGNLKTVRLIGYPEFFEGKCEKISGICQDIFKPDTTP